MQQNDWKIAWITGGSSGIGRELALQLADRGVRIAISARNRDDLQDVARQSDLITPFPTDVTDRKAVQLCITDIEDTLGPIDLAIPGAGILLPQVPPDFSIDEVQCTMDVNFMGVCNCIDPLLPLMRSRGAGRIAIIASVAGYRGLPRGAAYGPSKAALIALAESLQSSQTGTGVEFSVVNCGYVDTPLVEVNTHPMPFIIKPDDAARRIIDGLLRGKFEIAFPRRLILVLRVLNTLPDRAYFWFMNNVVEKKARESD